MFSSMIERCP